MCKLKVKKKKYVDRTFEVEEAVSGKKALKKLCKGDPSCKYAQLDYTCLQDGNPTCSLSYQGINWNDVKTKKNVFLYTSTCDGGIAAMSALGEHIQIAKPVLPLEV